MIVRVLTLACLILWATCVLAREPGNGQDAGVYSAACEAVSRTVQKEMAGFKVKGLALALVDGGHVVWASGFGLADEAGKLPMRPDTVVNLGSGAKLFTSLGAMVLAGQGRLALDAPVTGHLTGLVLDTEDAKQASGITARRLMSHHAGIAANYLKGLYTRSPHPALLGLDMLAGVRLAFTPGTVFSHSNLGTAILGMLVEKAAGAPFTSWMDQAVFAPLGMPDTSYAPRPQWAQRMATSYGNIGAYPALASNQPQAVSLYTTAQDQARFLAVLLGGGDDAMPKGITSETLKAMLAPQNADIALDMDLRVGLGWNLNRPEFGPPGTVAWNFGRFAGFRSLVMADLSAGLGVVVLANSSSAEVPRDSMIDRVADELLRRAMAAKGVPPIKPVAPASCSFLPLDKIAGDYATILGVVRVTVDKGRPVIRLDGKNLDLEPCSAGVYGVKFNMLGITLYDVTKNQSGLKFSFAEQGGRTYLVLHQHGERELFGTKVEPFPMTPVWEARLGTWVLDNQGDDLPLVRELILRRENDLVVYEAKLPMVMDFKLSLPIVPMSDSEARVSGVGGFSQAMGDAFRFETNQNGERLRYAGYVFRRRG